MILHTTVHDPSVCHDLELGVGRLDRSASVANICLWVQNFHLQIRFGWYLAQLFSMIQGCVMFFTQSFVSKLTCHRWHITADQIQVHSVHVAKISVLIYLWFWFGWYFTLLVDDQRVWNDLDSRSVLHSTFLCPNFHFWFFIHLTFLASLGHTTLYGLYEIWIYPRVE